MNSSLVGGIQLRPFPHMNPLDDWGGGGVVVVVVDVELEVVEVALFTED